MDSSFIIWDLDGTLVNSLPLTVDAFNEGLLPFLGHKLHRNEIMTHFGPPDQDVLRTLIGSENFPAGYKLMVQAFKEGLARLQHFSGIPETIAALTAKGVKQAVFTGRGRLTTDLILDHFSWRNTFVEVVTNDEVRNYKPHPEGALRILKNHSVSAQAAVMVGDTYSDFTVARDAGTKSLCALWDPWALELRQKLELKGVSRFLEKPQDILSYF